MKNVREVFPGVFTFESHHFEDDRGVFLKGFDKTTEPLASFNIQQVNMVQNPSQVLRGLHGQAGEFAEAKCFRILEGSIQVAFFHWDTHQSGSVFLQSPQEGVVIARGYGTGYLTLTPDTRVVYFSDNVYQPRAEQGIRWNDPLVTVQWQSDAPIVSEKDQQWPNWQ